MIQEVESKRDPSNSLTNIVLDDKLASMKKNDVIPKSLFLKSSIQTTLFIPFYAIGSNIKDVLEKELKERYERKCIREGYVRPNTIKIIQFSSGICRGNDVVFDVLYQAFICYPMEGTKIVIEITNVTKAGIRGKSRDALSPIDVFVARDHHVNDENFNTLQIGNEVYVEIIGHRYEINDRTISVIAELLSEQKSRFNIKDKE